MYRIARWLGRFVRAFSDGFRQVEKQPKWEVSVKFAHGVVERFEVNKDTWASIQRWMDDNEGGSFFLLETDAMSLRLNRDYVASVKGRRR
jgi:hypothetical protein